jgi:hypothetical protein
MFLLRLLFNDYFQIVQTGLEVFADHFVHIEKCAHYFPSVGIGTVHGPRDVLAIVGADVQRLGVNSRRTSAKALFQHQIVHFSASCEAVPFQISGQWQRNPMTYCLAGHGPNGLCCLGQTGQAAGWENCLPNLFPTRISEVPNVKPFQA